MLPFDYIAHISDVILYAYQHRASDLHFEPGANHYQIRMRQHGLLTLIFRGSLDIAARITTQLKVMAQLDIAEQRLPQDGRISFMRHTAHPLDIRINCCPTLFGEKIVLRLLDQNTQVRSLNALGLTLEQMNIFQHALARPQGLILVTGPTGSGKTTTLYTALHCLNQDTQHIVTVEDPIEITVPGVTQIPVHEKINLNFARILRSVLRQDPDIIMVGEIRDKETAEIAIQAAQTGHLVLSTLHASNGLETINRLVHMGIARYELISSLSLIIAQRLLRTLAGKERIGVYECIPMTPAVKQYLIHEHAPAYSTLKQHVPCLTLREAALQKVALGLTSLTEVNRMVQDD